jgi:hypothetical protein
MPWIVTHEEEETLVRQRRVFLQSVRLEYNREGSKHVLYGGTSADDVGDINCNENYKFTRGKYPKCCQNNFQFIRQTVTNVAGVKLKPDQIYSVYCLGGVHHLARVSSLQCVLFGRRAAPNKGFIELQRNVATSVKNEIRSYPVFGSSHLQTRVITWKCNKNSWN